MNSEKKSNAHAPKRKGVGLDSTAGGFRLKIMVTCCKQCSAVSLMLVLTATFSGGEARAYTNSWAVAVEGGAEAADQLAAKYGFTNLGLVTS